MRPLSTDGAILILAFYTLSPSVVLKGTEDKELSLPSHDFSKTAIFIVILSNFIYARANSQ